MQIELEFVTGQDDKGEDIIIKKTFIAKTKARLVRKAMTLIKEVDFNNLNEEGLDRVIHYLCEIYGNRFTIDDVYDGLSADSLIPTLKSSVEGIINGVTERLNTFPS